MSVLMPGSVRIVNGWLPSTTKSSTPCTRTVWGMFQFAALNSRLEGTGRASVLSELASGIVTGANGAALSTTVNEALSPASLVTRAAVGATVMPAASSAANGAENSDVFMKSSAVAVAVTASPIATGAASVASNERVPNGSVDASTAPR